MPSRNKAKEYGQHITTTNNVVYVNVVALSNSLGKEDCETSLDELDLIRK